MFLGPQQPREGMIFHPCNIFITVGMQVSYLTKQNIVQGQLLNFTLFLLPPSRGQGVATNHKRFHLCSAGEIITKETATKLTPLRKD